MGVIKVSEIKCEHCENWFRNYGVDLVNIETFDNSEFEDCKIRCTICGNYTGYGKENMRVVSDEGGFRGDKTF